ncbi:MAG TPA: hypothetical protein VJI96_01115 [Candidatus Andersenbacteria bacterium]|nr:hypothetical protein [Candidatus Andersenbacteria bacterium]
MKAKNQPLTQAQFDKSMERFFAMLEKKADKKDVERIVQEIIDANMQLVANAFERVATKEDIKNLITEERLKKALEPYATKEDMKEIMESLVERFENSVFATLKNHEQRITTLERA